jgi:hypothetical protein
MHLHGVAVTSDSQRIFTVGTLIKSADGLQPFKSRSEKQIIGKMKQIAIISFFDRSFSIAYNLDRKEVEK